MEVDRTRSLGFGIVWAFSCIITLGGTFAWLFCYGNHITAYIVTTVLLGIIGLFSYLSPRFRVACVLVVPHLGMRHGRSALLAVVVSLILAGPIQNMSRNGRNVIDSTVCASDLLANETDKVFARAGQPYDLLIKKVKDASSVWNTQARTYRNITHDIDLHLNALTGCVDEIEIAVSRVSTALYQVAGFRNGGTALAMSIDPTRIGAVRKMINQAEEDINGRLKSVTGNLRLVQEYGHEKLTKIQNELLQELGISSVHNRLRNITADYEKILYITQQLQEMGNTLKRFDTITQVMEYLTAFAFLLLYLTCWIYIKRYLKSDKYDNVYVTGTIRKMYLEVLESSGEKVKDVPFTRKQLRGLTNISSLSLSALERSQLLSGLVVPFIYAGVCIVLFSCDLALQWLVGLLITSSSTSFSISGTENSQLTPNGTGVMAEKVFPTVFQGFLRTKEFNASIDMEQCAPKLHSLEGKDYSIPFALLLAVFFLVLCDGYCLRLRQVMLAWFYPERSLERNEHLCSKLIKRKPKRFADFVKFCQKAAERAKNRGHLGMLWESSILSKCAFTRRLPFVSVACSGCGEFVKQGKLALRCKDEKCGAVYCDRCLQTLKTQDMVPCLLCGTSNVE